MIKIIDDLFQAYGFSAQRVNNSKLYSINNNKNKISFWLVIQEDNLALLLKDQSELYSECKNTCDHLALEKNLSMLILWNTGGYVGIKDMKRKVMSVEEDPYFFKKYVLYFSSKEKTALYETIGPYSTPQFFKDKIISQDVFARYKKDALSQSWQALLYRIAIKLPFIPIDIPLTDGLKSLFHENKMKIEQSSDKELYIFDQIISENYELKTIDDIKAMEPKVVLSELLKSYPTEGDSNGDKN